jgi:2-polyprenyl-3-methyl-5-hydroxy-6-metoxy-1,4-benzoquinol methylase
MKSCGNCGKSHAEPCRRRFDDRVLWSCSLVCAHARTSAVPFFGRPKQHGKRRSVAGSFRCDAGLEFTVSDRFGRASAEGYDRGFGSVSAHFVPALLRAARLVPGQLVLDIATGTGAAAEGAIAAVGPSGRVIATDLSRAMLEKAHARLGALPNLSFRSRGRPVSHLPGRAVRCSVVRHGPDALP